MTAPMPTGACPDTVHGVVSTGDSLRVEYAGAATNHVSSWRKRMLLENDLEVPGAGSVEENCQALGTTLGLDAPVPEAVLLGALQDPTYAHNLLVSRGNPPFLEYLLAHPPHASVVETGPVAEPLEHSSGTLLRRASRALWEWSKTGWSTVDEEQLQARENACLACPHLSEPTHLLQKMVAPRTEGSQVGQRTGGRVCTACGCNVSRKIRLPTESCPRPHPTLAGLTRWGELSKDSRGSTSHTSASSAVQSGTSARLRDGRSTTSGIAT